MPKQKRSTQTNFTWDPGHANEKQLLFDQSRTMYTAYGGARGGGKTHAVRIKAVGGAFTWPGIRILIVRKTYPELQSNHIEPILKMVPQELTSYNGTLHTLYFQNGSTIHFGHWSGITSESEYQGQEYDWIFMDEATQFTEREFRFLGGCLRGVNEIPKRFYLTCNPGGVGHRWVKRLFIDRNFKTDSANPEENENPDDYSFIFATVEDNKDLLESSPGYLQALSQLPENIRKAHRYGAARISRNSARRRTPASRSRSQSTGSDTGRSTTVWICLPSAGTRWTKTDAPTCTASWCSRG